MRFPVNIEKILKTASSVEDLRWLLLNVLQQQICAYGLRIHKLSLKTRTAYKF